MIVRLAMASLLARAVTVGMTVLAISVSVALFLGVEKVRTGAKASFADTISGTDLIVGARSRRRTRSWSGFRRSWSIKSGGRSKRTRPRACSWRT